MDEQNFTQNKKNKNIKSFNIILIVSIPLQFEKKQKQLKLTVYLNKCIPCKIIVNKI